MSLGSRWLVAVANMFVVVHVNGSYQIFAIPVFDLLESFLVLKMDFKPTSFLCVIIRNAYVALTMFIGITFPFFRGLVSFFGGFAFAPTAYFRFSLSWFTNWLCNLTLILAISVLHCSSPIGALRQIILQAKDFQFYS
ncbi:hypothetical protein SLA2020_284710 [Shorea laevis]